MDQQWVLCLILSAAWIFQLNFSLVSSYRSDFLPSRQGCIWSTVGNIGQNKSAITSSQVLVGSGFMLDCHVRTLNVDFWNYTFNREQLQQTSSVRVKCNEKLFFESFLTSNQTLFRLVNLKEVHIDSCKIRKVPGRVWASLGFLKTLVVRTQNGEWSSSVGLEIEAGGFDGLSQLETLDFSQNNIWSLPDKNTFCPLKSLLKLNFSRNRLSDIEELGFSNDDSSSGGENNSNNYCALSVQNVDLSLNALRRVGRNAFSRMRRLTELRLQNNLLEELEDTAFSGLTQLKLLNLSSNRLVALPPSIFRLNSNLREVYLQNNSISALSPQVFAGLENLLLLDLTRNTLTSQWIKENMFHGLHRLIVLKLSFNQLSYIDPTIFRDLISLQALHLDNNRLESINPQAFHSLSNLHILDLSNNRLSFIDSRIFSNLFVLRQLYLDHNKIRKVDDDALRNCTSLQDLGLADNLLQEVPVALRSNLVHLVTLDIGENRIGFVNNESFLGLGQLYGLRIVDNRLTELPRGFCEPLKKLRVLNLSQNRINKVSSSSLLACPELRALRLDTNALEELPATLAPQLPSLLWLNVSENRLRWADYHLLPATIEWLDLSYNSLESLGGPLNSERNKNALPYHLRVLDASHNQLTSLDYTTIPPTLETLRVNHNRLKSVAPDTFIRSSRLRRVELMGNQLQNIPLSALRISPVPNGKQLPEFYLGGNPFLCDCSMEWLTRVNQLSVLRQHPRIVDLDAIVCRPSFPRPNKIIPLVEAKPKDFLCPYKSHCFALCHCCDFDACDCEMTCPGNCTCYHDTAWSSNIVECSNLQFTEIPQRIPMDATEIYLDGNDIPQLGSHIFIGKKNLRVLYLNDSRVEFIRNKTFNGLKSLEVLRLEENLLTELHGYEFADLENLRELHLQNNLLRFISQDSFVGLKFLQVLRLDGNLLVDFNVWELSGNGYLNSVMLSGNPWSCECEFLIPFRTWVASKTAIVVDFTLAKCQMVNNSHSTSSSTAENDYDVGNPFQTQMKPQVQLAISSTCNGNKDMTFNFNLNAAEDEINNHISAMGGPEKVAVSHRPGSDQQIEYVPVNSDTNVFWFLVLTLTALVILIAVIILIFRKEIYYWAYSHLLNYGIICFPCCGDQNGKKSSSNTDDSDKLFDAYFLYSKKDEDILLQKIAPELEHGTPNFRLCLHYRDLCLNSDNPWNTDMILSACDASKRVVVVLSRTFLQSELTNGHFRASLQSAITRYQKKLILILLPPFTEQNLSSVYPELKSSASTSSSTTLKSSSLEWSDKNFWSKLKLILPTPCNTSHTPSTIPASVGELHSQSYTINRHEYPYNSHHHYHRNILPYQIPMSGGSLSANNTLTAPVPKHHIALSTPLWQQNHYNNNSQTQLVQNNIVSIPGIPSAAIHPISSQPIPQHFSFNESFRRHQQKLQQEHENPLQPLHPITFSRQQHHPEHPNFHCSSTNANSNAYLPLDQNYSSSAVSSSIEELDHVYSTLDSPLQSPNVTTTGHNNTCNNSNNTRDNNESANVNTFDAITNNSNNSCNSPYQGSPQQHHSNILNSNNANNNNKINNNNTTCNIISSSAAEVSQNNQNSNLHPSSRESNTSPGNNGRMYFV